MAEGFDFTISIPVEADLSRFRQQLGAELDRVGKTPAVVPVHPGGMVVRPASAHTAAASPTLAAVAAAATVSATTLSSAIPSAPRQSMAAAVAGAAMQAGMSQQAVAAAVQAAVPGLSAETAVAAAAAAGGGTAVTPVSARAARRGRFLRAPTAGGIRAAAFIGAHQLANSYSAILASEMGAASAESGEEALAARLQGVRGATSGIFGSVIGGILDFAGTANSPAALERAGRDVDRQERRIDQLRRTHDFHASLRTEGALARAPEGSAQVRIMADATHEAAKKQIQAAQLTQEASTRGQFGPEREAVKAATAAKIRSIRLAQSYDDYGSAAATDAAAEAAANQAEAAQLLAIGQTEAGALTKVRGSFDKDREDARAVRDRAIREGERSAAALQFATQGDTRSSLFRTRNQPFQAALNDLMTKTSVEMIQATPEQRPFIAQRGKQQVDEMFATFTRSFGQQMRGQAGESSATSRLLARDRLGASLASLHNQRDEILQEQQSLPWGFRQLAQFGTKRSFGLKEQLVRQEDADSREQRTAGLRAREEVTGLQAAGREGSAGALAIQRKTELEADAMRRAGGTRGDQELVLRTGLNELKSYQRQLRRAGDAGSVGEVSPGSYAPGAGRSDGQEPVVQGLAKVQASIDQMTAALNALIGNN